MRGAAHTRIVRCVCSRNEILQAAGGRDGKGTRHSRAPVGVFAFQGTLIVNAHWTTPGLGYVAVHRVNQHNCDVYDTLFVQVNSTIGIQEQALVPLQVYPNPASTQVTVVPGGQWRPGMRYAVLNALGQEVLFGALPASGVQPVDLSTRSLSAGVYTLQTTLDGKTDAVVRLVVER